MNKQNHLKKKKVKKIIDHQINFIFLTKDINNGVKFKKILNRKINLTFLTKNINNGVNYNKNYTMMSYLDNNMQKM